MDLTPAYLQDAYSSKPEAYFISARTDFVSLLPTSASARILELGCGNGATGALALGEGKCAQYVGIEMFEPQAREAQQVLTHVHVGDVAKIDLPYASGHFDALICSEVLEHLVDPAEILQKLVKLVRPGGIVLASSPNIAHYRIILELIKGKFDYSDYGAMDRTHLRWFTPDSFRRLFEEAGVNVLALRRPFSSGSRLTRMQERLPKFLARLFWYQIEVKGEVRS